MQLNLALEKFISYGVLVPFVTNTIVCCAQCMVVYCTIRNILSGFNTGIMNDYIGIF